MKSKGVMLVALISLVFIRLMYTSFEGVVVARLPFQPFSMMTGLTHYGLAGDNLQECSMTFMYILCNLSFGNYAKKLVGLEGQRIAMP